MDFTQAQMPLAAVSSTHNAYESVER
jgi:hypothetical protein